MFTTYDADLGAALRFAALCIAIVAAIVAVIVWIARRRGSTTVALDATLALSALWILASLVGGIVVAIRAATGGYMTFRGDGSFASQTPTNLPCTRDDAPGMLWCTSVGVKEFTITAPAPEVLALALPDVIVRGLLFTLPAVLTAALCWYTLRGRPFDTLVTRVLYGGAIAVLVLGVASELLGSITSTVALRSAIPVDSPWYPQAFSLQVTWAAPLVALLLAALAGIIRHGMRLQRERDALAKDTEGLV